MMNKLKSFLSKNIVRAIVLFVFVFWVYLSKSPNDIVSYGWSDDFIRSGVLGSSLKAPQFFILQTLIGFTTYLLPNLSKMALGYGLASFLGAGTIGFLFLIYSKAEESKDFPFRGVSPVYKIVSLLSLAFSYYFFTQSLVIERYILVVFLLSLLAYLSTLIKTGASIWLKILYTALFVVGILYHWIFLLYGFFELIFFIRKKGFKKIGSIKNYIFLGLLFIAFIFKVNLLTYSPNINYSFVRENTVSSLLNLYKITYLSDGFDNLFKYDVQNIKIFSLNLYGSFLQSIGHMPALIYIFGLFIILKYRKITTVKKYLWVFVSVFALMLVISGFDFVGKNIETYVLSVIILLVFSNALLWFGMMEFSRRFMMVGKIVDSKTIHKVLSLLLLLIISLYPVLKYRSINFNGIEIGIFARETLGSMDKDSYVVCFNNEVCSSLIYVQSVESIRKDVTIVPYWYNPKNTSLNLSKYRPFNYEEYPYILHEMVAELMIDDDTSLYAVGILNDYWDFFGFNNGFIHYIPLGYYGKLSLVTPKELPIPIYPHLSFESTSTIRDPLKTDFTSTLIKNRILNSIIYFQSGETDRGYNELNDVSSIAHTLHPTEFKYFIKSRNKAEQSTINPFFINSFELESINVITKEAQMFLENEYYGNSIKLIRGAILMSPHSVKIRLQAADIYQQSELPSLALKEYKNALILDKENEEAKRGINNIVDN